MSVLCGWASIDERGKASGGSAGDQTGREVKTGAWYNFGQTRTYRFKDRIKAEKFAKLYKQACLNENVGYDQYQRTTFWTEMSKVGWDPTKVKTKCETDCSAMPAPILKAIGISISKDVYSGNIGAALMKTGEFEELKASKYHKSPDYVMTGDIQVRPGHHVMVVLADGPKVEVKDSHLNDNIQNANDGLIIVNGGKKIEGAASKDTKLTGAYKVIASELMLRSGAGTDKAIIARMKEGTVVRNYGYYTKVGEIKWLYVAVGSYTGFCSSKYLSKV